MGGSAYRHCSRAQCNTSRLSGRRGFVTTSQLRSRRPPHPAPQRLTRFAVPGQSAFTGRDAPWIRPLAPATGSYANPGSGAIAICTPDSQKNLDSAINWQSCCQWHEQCNTSQRHGLEGIHEFRGAIFGSFSVQTERNAIRPIVEQRYQVLVIHKDGSSEVRASGMSRATAKAVHASLMSEGTFARVVILEERPESSGSPDRK